MNKSSTPRVSSTPRASRKGSKQAEVAAPIQSAATEAPVSTEPAQEPVKQEPIIETPAPAPEPVKAETPAQVAARFFVNDMARPTGSGEMGKALLFAHTAAFLEHSGLMSGKPVPSLYVNRALGQTAMAHHKAKFTSTPAGLMLTPEGMEFFTKRNAAANAEFKAGYLVVLTTGKPDGARVKNPAAIGEFKA